MDEATRIPPEQVAFCQKIAQLAKAHGCTILNLTFKVSTFHHTFHQPSGHARWDEEIQMAWEGMRHNENTRLHISTTLREYINIYEKQ